jgi:hypothetical protein
MTMRSFPRKVVRAVVSTHHEKNLDVADGLVYDQAWA